MRKNKKIIRWDGISGPRTTELGLLDLNIQKKIIDIASQGGNAFRTSRLGSGYLVGGEEITVTYEWDNN